MFDFFGVVILTIFSLLAVRMVFQFFQVRPTTGWGRLMQFLVSSLVFFGMFEALTHLFD